MEPAPHGQHSHRPVKLPSRGGHDGVEPTGPGSGETFTPLDNAAECQGCGTRIGPVPAEVPHGIVFASYLFCCPRCGGTWSETRYGRGRAARTAVTLPKPPATA